MAILRDIELTEFSVLTGDSKPANPAARALLYRAQDKSQENGMLSKLKDAVNDMMKGTRTIEEVYTYMSTSDGKTTIKEEPDAVAPPVAQPVVQSAAKAVPPPPSAPEALSEEVITRAVAAVIAPILEKQNALEGRLAKYEGGPVGSAAMAKGRSGASVSPVLEPAFPDFEKFLLERSGARPGQKLTRAAISSTGWSYGVRAIEAGKFIDYIFDLSPVLKQCRRIQMPEKKYPVDKIAFTGKISRPRVYGTDPGDTVAVDPTQVLLDAKDIVSIASVGDNTVQDNIEGQDFVDHLMRMIAQQMANELEEAAFLGDTTTAAGAHILNLWDGWLKVLGGAGGHVTNATADADRFWPGTDSTKASKLIKTVPAKYRKHGNWRWFYHPDLGLDYADSLAGKGSTAAFDVQTGNAPQQLRNIPIIECPQFSLTDNVSSGVDNGTKVLLTALENLIAGIHLDFTIKVDPQPRKGTVDFVIEWRGDFKVENVDASALYIKAQVKP